MTVIICYFLKSIKSVFILGLVLYSLTHEQKLCCTFNNCSLCDRLNLRKTVCAIWLSVHMQSKNRSKTFPQIRIRQQIAYNIRRISNLLKTVEVRTLSNSNFVTSLKINKSSIQYPLSQRINAEIHAF